MSALLIPILSLVLAGEPAPAAIRPRPVARVFRAETPPVIDGRLDDPAWSQAEPIGPLIQEEPDEGAPATQETDVRLMYDANYFYIGVRCYDREPKKIIATQLGRDADLGTDDRLRIILDTYHDRRNAFWFNVNAIGDKGDALESRDGQHKNLAWDGIWDAKSSIDDLGWVAEIAIPFKTLNFKPGLDTWGFNIARTIRRRQESDRWASPRHDVDFDQVSQAGEIYGLDDLRQGVGLDVRPFYVGRWAYDRNAAPPDRDVRGQGGVNAFYKVTPSLNATLTVNTDFAEAEVDERQINLTRFKVTFPERRDFFLEDAGIFQFADLEDDLLPFFSRTIGLSSKGQSVPIRAGGKLTGRQGAYAIGLLNVQTDAFAGTPVRNLLAARVSRNVGEQSTVGALYTRGDPESNRDDETFGVDGNYRTGTFLSHKNLTASAWGLATHTFGAEIGKDDLAYGASIGYPNDRWSWSSTVKEIRKNFAPKLGFVKRDDVRQYTAAVAFEPRLHNVIRKLSFKFEPELFTSVDNRLQTADVSIRPFGFETESGEELDFKIKPTVERLSEPFEIRSGFVVPAGDYTYTRLSVAGTTSDKRRVSASLEVAGGEFWTGHETDWIAGIAWRPGRHFNSSIDFEQDEVVLPAGRFTAQLTRLHANIQYSANLTWANFLQYDNESNGVGFNSSIRWIPSLGSELFLVFNESLIRANDTVIPMFQEAPLKFEYTIRF